MIDLIYVIEQSEFNICQLKAVDSEYNVNTDRQQTCHVASHIVTTTASPYL